MSDKEKVEKENEQFSSSILYVATAVYVGVCAMVFGALYAKLPTFGEAFLVLMKDYGTILAGIPVLVAVVVAKQQLDANRRQHVATVKRGLRGELEAIEKAHTWMRAVVRAPLEGNDLFSRVAHRVHVPYPTSEEIESLRPHLPENITNMMGTLSGDISSFNKRTVETENKREKAQEELDDIKDNVSYIVRELDEHYSYLSKYWS